MQQALAHVLFLDPAEFESTTGELENAKKKKKWTVPEKKQVYEALKIVYLKAPGLFLRACNGGDIIMLRMRGNAQVKAQVEPDSAFIEISDSWFVDNRKGFKEYTLAHEFVHYIDSSCILSNTRSWNENIAPRLHKYLSKHQWGSFERTQLIEAEPSRFGLPSDYAARSPKEALAECGAAIAMCSWNAPAPIAEFANANLLSRPGSVNVYLKLLKEAKVAYLQRDYPKAVAVNYQLLRIDSKCVPAWMNLVSIWIECLEPELAENCRIQALQLQSLPKNSYQENHLRKTARAIILKQQANLSLAENRLQESLDCLNKSIELVPNDPSVLYLRGVVLMSQGNPQKAFVDFDRSFKLDSSDIEVRHQRGRMALQLGKYELAIADLNKVIKAQPSADAYHDCGVAQLKLARYNEAIHNLSAAIRLLKANKSDENLEALCYFDRADCYLKIRDFDKAHTDLDRVEDMHKKQFGR